MIYVPLGNQVHCLQLCQDYLIPPPFSPKLGGQSPQICVLFWIVILIAVFVFLSWCVDFLFCPEKSEQWLLDVKRGLWTMFGTSGILWEFYMKPKFSYNEASPRSLSVSEPTLTFRTVAWWCFTHTHTYIYIYIYIYPADSSRYANFIVSPFTRRPWDIVHRNTKRRELGSDTRCDRTCTFIPTLTICPLHGIYQFSRAHCTRLGTASKTWSHWNSPWSEVPLSLRPRVLIHIMHSSLVLRVIIRCRVEW